MTTIDHAAEARKILHEATHDENGRVPEELLEDHEARNLALWWQEAHIHATLALVEQQRIANVITYVNGFGESDVNLIDREVILDIKKGLGLP